MHDILPCRLYRRYVQNEHNNIPVITPIAITITVALSPLLLSIVPVVPLPVELFMGPGRPVLDFTPVVLDDDDWAMTEERNRIITHATGESQRIINGWMTAIDGGESALATYTLTTIIQ
jgi:hypothetical protein